MGIKFKWFRHRLSFEPVATSASFAGPSTTTGLFRRSKSEAVIVTGYYRRSLDEEAPAINYNYETQGLPRRFKELILKKNC